MSLSIASLNSGSNGNCYYIGSSAEAILVDAGLSAKEIERRMNQLGLDMQKLKAIFITHEHSDHISGLPSIVKKFKLPVFITEATFRSTGYCIPSELTRPFQGFEPVQLGSLQITAFPKFHDAIDPHSLVISCGGVTIGVFTDIGAACENVIRYFGQCHAVFLETNYDDAMLNDGRYPYFLKRRITGGKGHLSNAQALQLFLSHRPSFMTHVLLSHLSSENNKPAIAEELFRQHANGIQIVHAPRDRATAVYNIVAGAFIQHASVTPLRVKKTVKQVQLSLF